jgi:hypothetical protein
VGAVDVAFAAVRNRHQARVVTRDLPRADSSDDGSADPRLEAALAAGDGGRIAAALLDTRLLVGVVALPGVEAASEGEMALALLESASGARALPAFSSVASLARWRSDARPVPRPTSELAAAVRTEGLSALVLDVAGPAPWVLQGDEIDALATGYVPAGESLTARRADPTLLAPSWEPGPGLLEACRGLEVYALDLDVPGRTPSRGPALGLVPAPGVPPAPVAERLLAAAAEPLDLLVLDGLRQQEAQRCGRRLAG